MRIFLSNQELTNLNVRLKNLEAELDVSREELTALLRKSSATQTEKKEFLKLREQFEKKCELKLVKIDKLQTSFETLEKEHTSPDEINKQAKNYQLLKLQIEFEQQKIERANRAIYDITENINCIDLDVMKIDDQIIAAKEKIKKNTALYTKKAYHLNQNYFGQFFSTILKNFKEYSALLYFLISVLGLTYSVIYYKSYDINILSYSNVIDFFLMGIRKEILLPVAAIGVLFAIFWGYAHLQRYSVQKNIKKDFESYIGSKIVILIIVYLLATTYSIATIYDTSDTRLKKTSIYNQSPIKELKHVWEFGQNTDYIFLLADRYNKKTKIIIPKNKILASENYTFAENDKSCDSSSMECIEKSYTTLKLAETYANWKLIHQINAMLVSDIEASKGPRQVLREMLETVLERELRKMDTKMPEDCRLLWSNPIRFRPNKSDPPNETAQIITEFFGRTSVETKSIIKLYVIGLASPDGPSKANQNLSEQRALKIKQLIAPWMKQFNLEKIPITPVPIGENHQINGLSDCKSVYLATAIKLNVQ
jgi:outer membrane protein OmpA-like peptidoglycan-associated protein